MLAHTSAVWLSVLCFAATVTPESPEKNRLERFSEKVRLDMTNIPNYTCLETIARSHREPHARSFKPADRIRLEVSSVAGKELFAWPGSSRFEDRDVTDLVAGGTMGTGMFNTFAHRLFVEHNGDWQYGEEENLEERAAVRYDFHLTREQSKMRITANTTAERVAVRGSFWFDPVSLDLLRLEVHGEDLPDDLHLEAAEFRTDYARVRIGETVPLLPKESELTITEISRTASRDQIDFSACREYATDSTISFDAPAKVPEAPKPAVREVGLPPGLAVPIELDRPIDSKTAFTGDVLDAHVVQEVRYQGGVVPRGAAVTGNLCGLEHSSPRERIAVCLQFSDIAWEGAHAAFQAELVDLDRKSAGTHRPVTHYDGHGYKVAIERLPSSAGMFYIDGAKFRIAQGFRMVWRTLPHAAGVR